jgi:Zn-dependent protease
MKCQKCQKETFLPFRCPYCGSYFCSEHRLPENHECPQIESARTSKKEKQEIIFQKQEPYQYRVTYSPPRAMRRKMHFSTKEIKHLTAAALLVVGIGLSWGIFSDTHNGIGEPFTLAMLTVILTASFFIHEIAHKIVAQGKGYWAEFRLTLMGAILTAFSIISPYFKIISPGAVMVAGFPDTNNMGKISIAGPATNITLSTMFLATAFLTPQHPLVLVFLLGAAFNSWIALFNLIPFGILDGFKVYLWNKKTWALAFTVSLVVTIISYMFYFSE